MPDEDQIREIAIEVLNLTVKSLSISLRYMSKAFSFLKWNEDEKIDGVAVDGARLYYNPKYIITTYKQSKEYMYRHYLHMVMHCVLQHFWINEAVVPSIWDLACDIAVENIINEMEVFHTVSKRVKDQQTEIESIRRHVKYFSAEHIYRHLVYSSISDSEISRLKNLFSCDIHNIWYEKEKHNNHEKQNNREKNNDIEEKLSIEIKKNIESKNGKKNLVYLLKGNPIIGMEYMKQWKVIATEIYLEISYFSKLYLGDKSALVQNLKAVTKEKNDYQEFLGRFAVVCERMKINSDEFDVVFYTYGLNLYGNIPLIEPLEYKDTKQIKDFVIVIDTSGSTSGELVQKFIRKTYSILMQQESFASKFNLYILQCDNTLQECVNVTSKEDFDKYIAEMEIYGMGGTDFRPAFEHVDLLIEKGKLPNLKGMIYFTDGLGIFPTKEPQYKVAFVYIDDAYNNPEVPPWAIKCVLESNDVEKGEAEDEYY